MSHHTHPNGAPETRSSGSASDTSALIAAVAAAQRIVHQKAPLNWLDGFPLGNGDLGVMLWGDGHPLALTLDKADIGA